MDEIDYESLPSDNLLAHLLAGGAAGMMEHCVMYPVDCIKVSITFFVYQWQEEQHLCFNLV